MKNIIYLFGILLLISCESELDLTPLAQNSAENFYNTESDLEQAVIATYDGVQSNMRPGLHDHFGEVRSDNTYNFATTPAGGAYADFDNFNLTSSNSRLNPYWSNSYQTIQRANIVLSRIGDISMDDDKREVRKGEVKFLRALTYFYLVQIWGDVPLVLEETTDPMAFIGVLRDPAEDVYSQIILDLTEAVSALPTQVATEDDGRVTKGAANSLLARVNLVLNQYDQVIEYTDKVINSGLYELDSDYSAIFDYHQNSNEEIFKIHFKSGTNSEGFPYLNVNHDYNNTASRDLMNTYENDARFKYVVDTTGIETYFGRKIHNEVVNSDNTIDIKIIILRYADILLMKAEALNALNYPSTEALEILNTVHTRVSGNEEEYTLSDFSSQNDFLDAILNERRIEFAFENLRWFDLVRTDRAIEVMNSKNVGGNNPNAASALPYSFTEKHLLFPIPQEQIDASGGSITQNPGY